MSSRLPGMRGRNARNVVVTGCAGFIGSHLCERLVADGFRVRGVDSFNPFYDRADKMLNLRGLIDERQFDLLELDLAGDDLSTVMAGTDTAFHLAAQAGVRPSFGDGFARYARDNVLATQRLFEAAGAAQCRRVVWASSSSVYGDAAAYPCVEASTPTQPRSPYGVTKRACEDLAEVYRIRGLPVVGLRYFTVYGPRQRPDMAIRRLCQAVVDGGTFPLYGDGGQTRDITYVGDVVSATVLAAAVDSPEVIYNVGGGEEVSLADTIALLEEMAGAPVTLERFATQAGDVRRTAADTSLARRSLAWQPSVSLAAGLRSELDWVRSTSAARSAA